MGNKCAFKRTEKAGSEPKKLLTRTLNWLGREPGNCNENVDHQKELVAKTCETYDRRAEQLKRKLLHLGQSVIIKIENSLWTAAHPST